MKKSFNAPVQIRRAADGDEGAVRALGKSLWFGGAAKPCERVQAIFTKYWDESYLRALCVMPNCTFVVAHDPRRCVGLAMANTSDSEPHRAKLSRFFLLPEYQNKGIELLLLRCCKEQLPPQVRQLVTCVAQGEMEQHHWLTEAGFTPQRVFQMENAPQPFLEMVKWIERDATTIDATPKQDALSDKQLLLQKLTQQAPFHCN